MIDYENLKKLNQPFFNEFKESFNDTLESGWYILGNKVVQFEQEFAAYCNTPHCVGLASGLDALSLALKCFDFKPGDEVIVPSNTYIATILSIIQNNLKPVLVEPDLATYNIDPSDSKKSSKTLGIVIYFPQNFLGDIINIKEELENIRLLFEKAGRGLEIHGKTNKTVSKMMQELLHAKGAIRIIILLQILNTIADSTECLPITHVNYIPINNKTESDRMNKIYHYIMKNFKHNISLEVIADLINMTPTSFSRYFKSRVNKSFSDFLKELRIDYARKLLNENKISINSVSYEAGYTTLSNFNKQFKEVTGKTPLQYRNEYLKIRTESM